MALIAGLRLARNRLSRDQLTAAETHRSAGSGSRDASGPQRTRPRHPPACPHRQRAVAALESRATQFPISVEILADDGLRAERFSEDVEGTAYFVACESFTNVAKHADTDGARIRLSHAGSQLCLVVEDDGQGFEPNGARSGGLANIRDRVEALHGQLTIESWSGAGTSIRADSRCSPTPHRQSRMSEMLRFVIAEDRLPRPRRRTPSAGRLQDRSRSWPASVMRASCSMRSASHPERCPDRYPYAARSPYGGHRGRSRRSVQRTQRSASWCCRNTPMRATPEPFSTTAPQVWHTCSKIASAILKTWYGRSLKWPPADRPSIR